MKKHNLGILGAGMYGKILMRCFQQDARAKILWVNSSSERFDSIYHIHHNPLIHSTFIEYKPNGAWAMNTKLAGSSPFIDWGVYNLSFHLGSLDDIPHLNSLRSFHRNGLRDMSPLVEFSDVQQHSAAWMEFDAGLTYYYERGAGVRTKKPNEARLYGTKDRLGFQRSGPLPNKIPRTVHGYTPCGYVRYT